MKITIWHKSGAGTELSADDFAYIEVDGKTVWNESALKLVEGQKPPTNTGSTKLRKIIIELGCRGVIGASERDTAIVDEICKRIVLSVDGKAVESPNELRNAIAAIHPGKKIPIEVLRNGRALYCSLRNFVRVARAVSGN